MTVYYSTHRRCCRSSGGSGTCNARGRRGLEDNVGLCRRRCTSCSRSSIGIVAVLLISIVSAPLPQGLR